MTESRPGAEDPRLIVRQLQTDIADIEGADLPDELTDVETWGENLAGRTDGYPAAVQAAADLCIPAAEVTSAARKRFIDAAERALSARRARTGLLPVALSVARRRAGLSVAQVQASVAEAGFDANVADLESGRRNVRQAGPGGAAAWIFAVKADSAEGLASYRRSLEADSEGELRPAAGTQGASGSVDDLVAKAAARLDELNREVPMTTTTLHVDHAALVAFATSHVNLPKTEVDAHRGQVQRLRDKLKTYIADHPDYGLIKTVHSGSVAKGTALKSISDMDVAAYLDASKVPAGQEGALISEIATMLRAAYGATKDPGDFEEQAHSVKVHFHGSGLDVDVVPVVYAGLPEDRGDLITKSGEKVETSVQLHKEFIRIRRTNYGANFTQVVRFLKYWARSQKAARGDSFRCKSFLLELIVAHLADNGLDLSDYPTAIEGVFAWMVRTDMSERVTFTDFGAASTGSDGNPIQVIDPVNSNNNVCRTYTNADRAALVEAANDAYDAVTAATYGQSRGYSIDCWKEVFGPTFRG